MNISLVYDDQVDAWTLQTVGVLSTEEDVLEWRQQLSAELERIGKRVYLLVDMSKFEVRAAMANQYGSGAKEIARKYTQGIIRYGPQQGVTGTTVRLESVINRFPANIFANRAGAIAALEKMRLLPLPS